MLKNSLIYLVARVINGIVAIISFYALSRLLNANEYGIYALGTAAVGFFGSVFFQWISVSIARFYAEYSNRFDVLLNEAMSLFFWMVGISIFVLFAFAFWPNSGQIPLELALAVFMGGVAIGAHNIGLQVANAASKPLLYGALTTTRSALSLFLAVVASYFGLGGVGAVFGMAIATAFVVMIFKIVKIPKKTKKNNLVRLELIQYGLPLTLTYLAAIILDISDRFIIAWKLGAAAVAPYAAAYDLTQQVLGALANVLFLASYPKIMNAWKVGDASHAKTSMEPLSNAFVAGTPLVTGIFIGWSSEISEVIFGGELRREASMIIPWIAVAVAIGSIKSFLLDIVFQLEKKIYIQVRITMAMAFLNVILTFAFLPTFGILGAAIATTIAFALGACASWWFGRKLKIYSATFLDIFKSIAVLVCVVMAMESFEQFYDLNNKNAIAKLFCGLAAYFFAAVVLNLSRVRHVVHKSFHRIKFSSSR